MEPETQQDGLEFRLSEDGRELVAVFPEKGPSMDEAALERAFAAAGMEGPVLFPDALVTFALRTSEGEPFKMVIGGRRDATFTLRVTNKDLFAYAEVTPPFGGANITIEKINDVLEGVGVSECLLKETIAALPDLAASAGGKFCAAIARGRAPINGRDATLQPLFENIADRRPHISEDGWADYRELGEFLTVEPGTPIVRILPPEKGEEGLSVKGETLFAFHGQPMKVRAFDASVRISPEEPDVVIAQVSGHPVVMSDGVKVEPVLTFENVDVGTGNVIFDGSVVVNGDVRNGMRIDVTGDIHVKGTIEAAHLRAGGSIEIGGGAIGWGTVRDERGGLRPEAVQLQAEGRVSIRFMENAYVVTNGNLSVRDMITHCDITAGAVSVGDGRGKGRIIGGVVRGKQVVRTAIFGSPAAVMTCFEAGPIGDRRERLAEVNGGLTELSKQLYRVQDELRMNPSPARTQQLRSEGRSLSESARTLLEQRKTLEQEIAEAEKAEMFANQRVYPNVHVNIANRKMAVADERGSVIFRIEDGRLVCR